MLPSDPILKEGIIQRGGTSRLVTGLVFKTSRVALVGVTGGFDSHVPPPYSYILLLFLEFLFVVGIIELIGFIEKHLFLSTVLSFSWGDGVDGCREACAKPGVERKTEIFQKTFTGRGVRNKSDKS